ncbi:TPA: PKD domain-containing protein [Candidatus Woesearchaeota archaeon]|nr:PKD domain-containing protein [Candidatus Woesearchaeota archaeon]
MNVNVTGLSPSTSYTVTLVTVDTTGNRNTPGVSDSATTAASGSSVPAVVAWADATSGSSPLTVNFDAVVVGGDAPLTYAWDVDGDGVDDFNTQSPSYIYNSAGTYNASVTVCDADMDCDTDYIIIIVGAAVSHDISVNSIDHNKAGTTSYLWDLIEVNSTIENHGDVTEFVSVDLLADGVVVDTEVISVDPGMTELVTLEWASADPDGWRMLEVRANPVTGEVLLGDNSLTGFVEVWSVEDIVSTMTRELFLSRTDVATGGTFNVFLPVQNDFAIESFEDMKVQLSYNASAFTVTSPTVLQLVDLAGGQFKVVQWTVMADGPAGNYLFSASLGNNEITNADITGKVITVT